MTERLERLLRESRIGEKPETIRSAQEKVKGVIIKALESEPFIFSREIFESLKNMGFYDRERLRQRYTWHNDKFFYEKDLYLISSPELYSKDIHIISLQEAIEDILKKKYPKTEISVNYRGYPTKNIQSQKIYYNNKKELEKYLRSRLSAKPIKVIFSFDY